MPNYILICKQCGKEYCRKSSRVEGSLFCSRACKDASQKTAEWTILNCANCGKEFARRLKQAQRPTLQFCGYHCSHQYNALHGKIGNHRWSPETREKVRQTKIVNAKRGNQHSQYKQLPNSEIVKDYLEGASCWELAKKYSTSVKTILRRVREEGVIIDRRGSMGKILICNDGHKALSRAEFLIDNWLSHYNIIHEVHPSLPWGGSADFLVAGVYVEYWGVQHSLRYEERKQFKISQYQLHELSLFSIYPQDIVTGGFVSLLQSQFLK